jgi:hypothetical protein
MSPTTMTRSLLSTTFLVTLGLWTGAGVFFSTIVLPTLFINLESTVAGQTAALLFPGYYAFGIALGAILLGTACLLGRDGGRGWRIVIVALAVAWACQLYAGLAVRPRMSALRGEVSGVEEFQRLHRLSVRLNAIVLIGTVGVLVASASLINKR